MISFKLTVDRSMSKNRSDNSKEKNEILILQIVFIVAKIYTDILLKKYVLMKHYNSENISYFSN